MSATPATTTRPEVSVIIPARNEEANLGTCLQSLISQTDVSFEIIVVDDHSTDRTREIAQSFPVRVIEAGPLPRGWTGKNNAVATGAREAQGQWILFTDADTVHLPGSLAGALAEAKETGAEMLSYSPEQVAVTFWEMAVLPVVFAELARQYSPTKVSDPASPVAAANGQYILISREAYGAVGGHAAVADNILEDVALARAVKASGRKILFRYASDRVRTRMYRNFRQLREGWTKNLALLFPNPGWLAARRLMEWGFPWAVWLWPLFMMLADELAPRAGSHYQFDNIFLTLAQVGRHWWWFAIGGLVYARLWMRLRRANFDLAMEFLAPLFGMPMFAYLLLRSKRAHAHHNISWKGRTYAGEDHNVNKPTPHTPTAAERFS